MTNKKVYLALALFLTAFWTALLTGAFQYFAPTERVIDCSMAEFHPDFTPEVRKACRERRSHKL